MVDPQSGIEGQLKYLAEQVEFLQAAVDELSGRLQNLEKGRRQQPCGRPFV